MGRGARKPVVMVPRSWNAPGRMGQGKSGIFPVHGGIGGAGKPPLIRDATAARCSGWGLGEGQERPASSAMKRRRFDWRNLGSMPELRQIGADATGNRL